nr:immunoglobulin heavy chain junction region [Macaca mulatta]
CVRDAYGSGFSNW